MGLRTRKLILAVLSIASFLFAFAYGYWTVEYWGWPSFVFGGFALFFVLLGIMFGIAYQEMRRTYGKYGG